MNWETAMGIKENYDQVMHISGQFKKEASVKRSRSAGAWYVESPDGEFHRVGEWNSFVDTLSLPRPHTTEFYHVTIVANSMSSSIR